MSIYSKYKNALYAKYKNEPLLVNQRIIFNQIHELQPGVVVCRWHIPSQSRQIIEITRSPYWQYLDNWGKKMHLYVANQHFSDTGANFTAGLRLKLAIFTIHADYNFQQYNSITAGIGFSFR